MIPMKTWAVTDIGLVRKENQDDFGVVQHEATGHTVCVVCDGMGGAAGGQVASHIAVTTFLEQLQHLLTRDMTPEQLREVSAYAVSMANKAIREAALKYTVFGRVTPQQKKELVAALQKKKHTVAMTGDGVNDLLAMKQANCAIAMASGAEAASSLASLVLLDSDFSAMPGVVAEGRRVINNIQRAASLFLVKNIFSLFLSVITLFTAWPYPLVPIHLTVISAMTIGIPSFILTFEPKYDRVQGKFLPSVLRRAFPGGLSNVFVVLVCQLFMVVFDLPQEEVSTICAAILSFVGLLVLFQICKPFHFFRGALWCAMAAGIVVCFTFLGDILDLRTWSGQARLVMGTLLVMTPTVFFFIQRVFDTVYAARIRVFTWFRSKWYRIFRKK